MVETIQPIKLFVWGKCFKQQKKIFFFFPNVSIEMIFMFLSQLHKPDKIDV